MIYFRVTRRVQLLILCLIGLVGTTQAQDDAVILLDNKTVTHDINQISHVLFTYSRTTEVSRKIKISSQWALEEFSQLYVPTYENLDFTFTLTEFNAQTVKKSGEVVYTDADRIKETTLPANVPFLYGYDGSVKQVAFQDLEIGDVVEYSYTTRLVSSVSNAQFSSSYPIYIGNEFPTARGEYKLVTTGKFLKQKVFDFNASNLSISQDENTTTVRFKDLPGYKEEAYAYPYAYQPYLIAHIFNKKDNPVYESWEDMIKSQLLQKADRRSYFFGGLRLIEIAKQAKEENSVLDKMRSLRDQMQKAYAEDVYKTITTHRTYKPDLYDANQVFKIMKLLDIEAQLLFVKKRGTRVIIEELPDMDQLDDFILKFKDERGQFHYWNIFNVYSTFDRISYEYQDTPAVQLTEEKSKKLVKFVKFSPPTLENQIVKNYNFIFKVNSNSLEVKTDKKVAYTGQYALLDELEYEIENLDSTANIYSAGIKKRLFQTYDNCEILDFDLVSEQDGQVYKTMYQHTIPNYTDNLLTLTIKDLIAENYALNTSEKSDRVNPADLHFTYSKKYKLSITPPAGYKMVLNQSFNKTYKNDVGNLLIKGSRQGQNVIIDLEWDLLKHQLSTEEWSLYADFMTSLDEFMNERLVMVKL